MEASRYAPKEVALAPEAAEFTPATRLSPVVTSIDLDPLSIEELIMDEFAQTRPPDDLFSDDFTPIETPVVVQHVEPSPQLPVDSTDTRNTTAPRPERNRNHRQPATSTEQRQTNAPNSAINQHSAESRLTSGGAKPTKLSESDLSARITAIKAKNATREAAHARAEADVADFNAREAADTVRRKAERQNRAQLMGEREKNRATKLRLQGRREWDEGKVELDEPRRSSAFSTDNARGKGDARPRGNGRGRGGSSQTSQSRPQSKSQPQLPPTASDFPDLTRSKPIKAQPEADPQLPVTSATNIDTPAPSWAEEMDSSIAIK